MAAWPLAVVGCSGAAVGADLKLRQAPALLCAASRPRAPPTARDPAEKSPSQRLHQGTSESPAEPGRPAFVMAAIEWVVEAHVGEGRIRVPCGRGEEPPKLTVAWLGEVAMARWHAAAPADPAALAGALDAIAAEPRGEPETGAVASTEGHGLGSKAARLASVLAMCRGTRRLGAPTRVCKLGRSRLIGGQWRPEETELEPLATLADGLFADPATAATGTPPGMRVARARVYGQAGPSAAPADSTGSVLDSSAQMTAQLAERRRAELVDASAAADAASSAGAAATPGGAGDSDDSSDEEEDDRPVLRRAVRRS